ncbi:hypothetical protein FPQ18DRAFT_93870 [Pyronema domesticum]|uniref:Similar to Transcriptional regulator prz1 acc. no. Q09838 n=1 Tax=Pyronema omphalodes (strain CBS 100304) TaxID=1076935 RepID=U4L0R3_PYROM|nr:hypothetical protein FPQ18DRAFT_93870 [Pyronema domesticum]CCX07803.1 Similar to Transcriptional regulator prz1; acc. no. Q09838 [Pyronema omphalodes CBS 100304]
MIKNEFSGNSHADAAQSASIAERRQRESLPRFDLTNARANFGGISSFPTPPPLGQHEMANSLTGSNVAGVSSYGGYQPSNASPFGYLPGMGSVHAARSSFNSPGTYGQRNVNRPHSPSIGEMVPSSPYENAVSTMSLPGRSPSGSIGQQDSSYASSYNQHNHLNSQPQQPTTHNLYSPHSGSAPPPPPPPPSSGSYYTSSYPPLPQMSPNSPSSTRPMSAGTSSYQTSLVPLQPQPHPQYRPPYSLPVPMGSTVMGAGHLGNSMMHHIPRAHHPVQDRPFKCDVCPQSFSRNHDLKRHKRIHLAVKPFPCDNCDKSFSRKDALKRHRLVKGCGKASELRLQAAAQQQITEQQDQDRNKMQSPNHHSSHHDRNVRQRLSPHHSSHSPVDHSC